MTFNHLNPDIRAHRTAQVSLTLKDRDGALLTDREVTIAQTNHRFLFGASWFDLPYANGELAGAQKELSGKRFEMLRQLCNTVTLPFYWGRFEPERGRPETQHTLNAARFCAQHGLKMKGHPLCWHTVTADWLLSLTNEEILRAQVARIQREVSDFRGLIDAWDVINEAVIMPIFDRYDNGITRICKQWGRIETIRTMFAAARAANPSATLLINDFDVSPAYDILVEGCLEGGLQFDAIGIQSHMHQGYWGVEKTQRVLEQFTRFKLPIHFTETTLVSGQLMPPEIVDLNDYQVEDWPTTPEGEERQAQEALTHYQTLLGNPLVQGITWWDIMDGGWLNAPAGLIRRDASPKPAYTALHQLIKGEWWLAPTQFATNSAGTLHFEGFLGDYTLECQGQSRAFALEAAGPASLQVTL